MATISRKTQSTIKNYRLWAVMAAEDRMRMVHEREREIDMGLHNHHIWAKHNKNRDICLKAQAQYAKELGLDY